VSQENVEVFLRGTDAICRGDRDAILETAHPDLRAGPLTGDGNHFKETDAAKR
jgi:hypothetical protein